MSPLVQTGSFQSYLFHRLALVPEPSRCATVAPLPVGPAKPTAVPWKWLVIQRIAACNALVGEIESARGGYRLSNQLIRAIR